MDRAVAIDVSHLSKSYDGHHAVKDISFQVYAGEIFGLLGPNGAGKSTTLRTLITLLSPTSGRATISGLDSVRDADRVRQLIGYVPQERAIDRFLTGREHLELLGALYHLTKDEARRRIAELLKLVELEAHADRPAKTYSGGMKRKLDIACGLLPDPKVLFLDEPTLGLDVQSRLKIWDYIRLLKTRGMTVVMTTNYLDEADQLCDRLAIIDGGVIKTIGSPVELKVGLGGDIVSLTLKETDKVPSLGIGVERPTRDQGGQSDVEGPRHPCRIARKGAARHPGVGQPGRVPASSSSSTIGRDWTTCFIAHTGRRIEETPVSDGQ